jgi:hypothetical protein
LVTRIDQIKSECAFWRLDLKRQTVTFNRAFFLYVPIGVARTSSSNDLGSILLEDK